MQPATNQESLLKNCVCGNGEAVFDIIHDIPVLECTACGIRRQDLPGYTVKDYFDYYLTDYHTKEQEKIGCKAYKDRYLHDSGIAAIRLTEYENVMGLKKGLEALDIGSSNNAFVDWLNANGYHCKGIEIGEEGKKHPKTTYNRDLLQLNLPENSFDLITLHDVFEHLVAPDVYLDEIRRIMKKDAFMVLDLPNYFVPEGVHHWRPVQHLWFFNRSQTIDLLAKHYFSVVCVTQPIPSKLVFYCRVIK